MSVVRLWAGRRRAPRAGRLAAPSPSRPRARPEPVSRIEPEPDVDLEALQAAAEEFLQLFHTENPTAGPAEVRIAAVRREIDITGTYWHTPDELVFGARVAWRNNERCIGRLYWRSLQVRDLRDVSTAGDVAAHCFDHLRDAYNGGKIRPMISVFAPETPTTRRAPDLERATDPVRRL